MKKFFLSLLLATVLFALNGSAQTTVVGTKWLFSESKVQAIPFDLSFEAGGKATWKQTNGSNTGTFTWSGTPENINVEGAFGSGGRVIKMTGNITTGKLGYVISGGTAANQTGEYNAKGQVLQVTKTNLYNEKGTQIAIVTKNFSTTLTCAKTLQLFNGTTLLGTWLQNSTGTGETPFVLSVGKNELVGNRLDLLVYTGTYNVETGACKLMRLGADANNGITGTCTITVNR